MNWLSIGIKLLSFFAWVQALINKRRIQQEQKQADNLESAREMFHDKQVEAEIMAKPELSRADNGIRLQALRDGKILP